MKKPVILLLHAGYWLMYACLIVMICNLINMGQQTRSGHFEWSWFLNLIFLFGFFPAILGFYIFYFVFFPRFLSKRKVTGLIVWGLITIVGIASLCEMVMSFSVKGALWNMINCMGIGSALCLNIIPNGILGLVMRGFIDWYGDIKIKEDLGKKNHEMELALIKSQINPHFLFNTLNNIDVLILKDPPKASEYLNKLSDMMRFMLYETKTEKIALAEELGYIEKYIALQKIRTANPSFVSYAVTGTAGSQRLEPMLFIPFIENAFKHTENKNIKNAITIRFEISPDKITFECRNQYSKTEQTRPDYGGLGNELIRKRLLLLYSKKHSLHITDQNQIYSVTIVLNLT